MILNTQTSRFAILERPNQVAADLREDMLTVAGTLFDDNTDDAFEVEAAELALNLVSQVPFIKLLAALSCKFSACV